MEKKGLIPDKVVAYTDGGALNNPGPAAIGIVIVTHHNIPRKSALSPQVSASTKEYAESIGTATNNQAEYRAVIFALKKIKALVGKTHAKNTEVEIRLDSELAGNQLNRKYKIREPELKPLFVDAWNEMLDFKKVSFVVIPRERNKRADQLVKSILFKKEQRLF